MKISTFQWGLAALVLAVALPVRADVVTDANARAAEIVSRHPATPVSVRMMAFVQVSVFEAVNAITGHYPPYRTKIQAAPGASVDAAVAAATRMRCRSSSRPSRRPSTTPTRHC